ncbi:MAG: S-methyl-5-thioribose-1-phosphate isomerase [Pirellulaceae bacterium]|nr:S-methyl-5-thioribose-1-phosphate isomerase [Pirellulaceae bacterium]
MLQTQSNSTHHPAAVQWMGDCGGYLQLIDQTCLPRELKLLECRDVSTVWEAIKMLRVRGAPAIGIAAAYGVCVAVRACAPNEVAKVATEAAKSLATSRPTAVNLFWALDRMQAVIASNAASTEVNGESLRVALLAEAKAIHEEDRAMCHAIGRHGAELIPDHATLITHCNAGGLATAEYGTALSVMFTCQDQGKSLKVFADETRPLLQGARLTAFELHQRGIPTTVICDSMAAHVMQTQKIDAVIVGADRITARGDVANKIGTYGLAVVAKHHGVPFYVAAPSSTFDLTLMNGSEIPIEQRSREEVVVPYGQHVAPDGVGVYNPAFDVTPAELVTALITEHGVIRNVNVQSIADHFAFKK